MKKRVWIFLMTLTFTLILIACGKSKETTPSAGDSSTKKPEVSATVIPTVSPDITSPSVADFNYDSAYIDEHLKGDYSITYKISSSGTGETTAIYDIKMMHTDEGYYISLDEGTEMLYIKNGDKYTLYMGNTKDGFIAYGEPTLTEEEVKSQSQMFLSYMTIYGDFKDQLIIDGSEVVAGRDCDRYDYDYLGSKLKYEYYIDKETGVCMKFYIEGSGTEGFGQFTFECTEFITSGVTLPKYK